MPAPEPTYVNVDKFKVQKTFDSKYKTSVPKRMAKLAEKVVERSKLLTTRKPRDRKQEGFYLAGGVTKLVKAEKGGKILLAAEVKLLMATWPKRSMFAFPSASAKVEVGSEKEIDAGVEDLIDALTRSVVKDKVVKEFEKRAKKLAKA